MTAIAPKNTSKSSGISLIASQVARAAVGMPINSPSGFAPSSISQKTRSATKRGSKERAEVLTSAKGDAQD